MNIEDFVTYEQAVKLKEYGFDWPCIAKWAVEPFGRPALIGSTAFVFKNSECKGRDVCAPTMAQAAKWLREVKGLFISIWLCAAGYGWSLEKCGDLNCNGTFIAEHDENSGNDKDSGMFTTYEKALSSGIDEALKILEYNGK